MLAAATVRRSSAAWARRSASLTATSTRSRHAPLVTLAQDTLAAVQLATGAPWWMTISGSAVALRIAILPSVMMQVRETRRLMALRPRFAALRAKCATIEAPNERAWKLATLMFKECDEQGVRLSRVVGLPLIQIPALIGAVVAIRSMLTSELPYTAALREGGALTFRDLTAPDASAILPVVSLVVLVANLQLSAAGGRGGGLLQWVRDIVQAGSVVAFPFYAELPSGVFVYLIPNSLFSFAQTTIVRRAAPMAAAVQRQGGEVATQAATAAASAAPTTGERGRLPAGEADSALAGQLAAAPHSPQPSSIQPPSSPPPTPEEAELRRRIEADVSDVEAHVRLSKAYLRAKRPADAVAHLWPAVRATPQESSAPLRFQLALALALQEQHDVAEPLLEQVLKLEPEFAEALLCLCATQEALGKTDAALATLDRVASLRPELANYCAQESARLRAATPSEEGE